MMLFSFGAGFIIGVLFGIFTSALLVAGTDEGKEKQ